MTIAYLNGQFLPLTEARVSVMDRGFLFGDGVYEVIPIYNGHPFRLSQHLQRLTNSLAAIKITVPKIAATWDNIINELITRNNGDNQSVYLQITRGAALTRDHAFPTESHPTVFAYSIPLLSHSIAELSKGITAITVNDIRWQRCDIKAITLLPNVLLRQEAIEQGAQEAILLNNGFAIEGSAMNLFIVKNGVIITAPLSAHILGGITRDLVLELAKKHGYPTQETNISAAELANADEVWVTSSNREIVPVVLLNKKPVANGQAGAIWQKMIGHYQEFKRQYANEN